MEQKVVGQTVHHMTKTAVPLSITHMAINANLEAQNIKNLESVAMRNFISGNKGASVPSRIGMKLRREFKQFAKQYDTRKSKNQVKPLQNSNDEQPFFFFNEAERNKLIELSLLEQNNTAEEEKFTDDYTCVL